MAAKEINHLRDEAHDGFRARWNNREFVGSRIAERRKQLGLSQNQIGVYLGVSREWISVVESGRGEINAGDLAVMAKLLDIQPSYFLDMAFWNVPQSNVALLPEERELASDVTLYFPVLPVVLKRIVVQLLRSLHGLLPLPAHSVVED